MQEFAFFDTFVANSLYFIANLYEFAIKMREFIANLRYPIF